MSNDDGVPTFSQIQSSTTGHEQPITALCVTNNTLWSAGSDRRLRAYEAEPSGVRVFVVPPTAVSFLVCIDSQCCYALDAGLYALDTSAGHSRLVAQTPDELAAVPVCGAVDSIFDSNRNLVWLGYTDRVVRAFVDGVSLFELRGHRDAVRALALSGEHLFSAGDDGYVLRWHVRLPNRARPTGQFDFVHQGLRGPVRALVATSASLPLAQQRIFWAEQDVVVALKLASFQRLDLSAHPRSTVLTLAFDHGFLFSGASDRTIVIWDVDASAPVVRLTGAGGPINAIALLGNAIAAASTTLADQRPAVLQWSLQAAIASAKNSTAPTSNPLRSPSASSSPPPPTADLTLAINCTVRMEWDFSASQSLQVSAKRGAKFTVVALDRPGWLGVQCDDGRIGYVPQNYTKVVAAPPAAPAASPPASSPTATPPQSVSPREVRRGIIATTTGGIVSGNNTTTTTTVTNADTTTSTPLSVSPRDVRRGHIAEPPASTTAASPPPPAKSPSKTRIRAATTSGSAPSAASLSAGSSSPPVPPRSPVTTRAPANTFSSNAPPPSTTTTTTTTTSSSTTSTTSGSTSTILCSRCQLEKSAGRVTLDDGTVMLCCRACIDLVVGDLRAERTASRGMIAGARERRADGKERKLSSKASVAMEQTRLTVSSGDGKRVLYVAPLLRAEVTHFARKPHQFGVRLANGDSLLISVPRGTAETTTTVSTWMRGIMSLATRLDASFTSRAIDSARILAPSLGSRQVQLLLNAVIGRVGDSAALRDVLLGAHVARYENGGANNNASNDAAARMLAVQQHVCNQFFAAVKDPSAPAPASPRLDRAFVELSQRRITLGQFAEATLTVHNDGQCGVFVEPLPVRALPNGVVLTVDPSQLVVPPRGLGTLRCRVRFDCSRVLRVLQQLRLTSDNGGYQCSLFVPIVGESEPSLDLAFDDVEFGDQIGSGQFGTVFKGLLRGGGRASALPVAVKVIGYPDDFEQERAVMRSLPPHDNIVEFFGSATRRPFQGFLVFAYYPLGSLDRLIYADELAAPLALTVAREIIDALRFLHAKHVLHLDLKPQNVLVCSTDLAARVHIKLCDFGIARTVDSMRTFVGAQVEGTLLYMAPEMLDKVYSPKVDVYSFGVCLWEMLVRKLPFSDAPFTEMSRFQFDIAKAGGALPGPMPAAVSARVRVLLERCLSSDRELRPSSDTLGELLAALAPDDFQPMPLAAEQRAASLARKESRMPKVVNRFARSSQILLVSGDDDNRERDGDDGAGLSDAQLRNRFHRRIARADAEALLRGKPAGTFVLRSRGREPLALSFVDSDGATIKHAGIVEHKDGGFSLDSQPPSARQPRLVQALQSLGAKLKFNDDLLHMDFAILEARQGGADDDDDDDIDDD